MEDERRKRPRKGKALVRSLLRADIKPVEIPDSMLSAHALYQQLLKVRDGSRALALYRNLMLKRPSGTTMLIGGGVAFLGLVAGFPFLGLLFGGAVVLGPSAVETRRVRDRKSAYRYQAGEYCNIWVQMCHRWVLMAKGFNARLTTAKTLQGDGKKLEAVALMNALLMKAREALEQARATLANLELAAPSGRLYEQTLPLNERLLELDPLDFNNGAPALAWLELESHRDHVPIQEFEMCLYRDVAMLGSQPDLEAGELDPFERLKRDVTDE